MSDAATLLQIFSLLALAVSYYLFIRALSARRDRLSRAHIARLPIRALDEFSTEQEGVRVLVDGNTSASPSGPLASPFGQQPCVWFRTEVWTHQPAHGIPGNRMKLTMLFTEQSHDQFQLADRTGETAVHPLNVNADELRPTYESFIPDETADSGSTRIGPYSNLEHPPEHMLFSTGHTYKEWIIKPGERLLVEGDIKNEGTTTSIAPTRAPLIFHKRTSPELDRSRRLREALGFLALPAAAVMTTLVFIE